MKIVRIFGIVLALHGVMLLVFFQPGCQSKPRPQAESTTGPATGTGPAERLEWEDDVEFPGATAQTERPRSSPTRPPAEPAPRRAPDEGALRPLPPSEPSSTASAPTPREPGPGGVYTVQRGDSLWVIAQRHNVSLNSLLSINGLNQSSVIRPGQELLIPSGGSAGSASAAASGAPLPSGTTSYTVERGDSLSVIAQRHGTTVSELRSLNNLSNDIIRIGQTLVVPKRSSSGTRSSGSSAPAPSAQRSPAGEGGRHVVQSGETPGGIASKHGITVDALMSANNMSDPRRMQIGQELIIPGGAKESPAPAPRREPEPEPAPEPNPSRSEPAPRPVEVLPSEEILDDEFPLIPIEPENR